MALAPRFGGHSFPPILNDPNAVSTLSLDSDDPSSVLIDRNHHCRELERRCDVESGKTGSCLVLRRNFRAFI
jgi:hypothetical protein